MFIKKSSVFFLFAGLLIIVLCLLLAHGATRMDSGLSRIEREAQLVKKLELTDLSLFTEARYTRHLSQADLHSAFQDHPVSLEHFPSGSLVKPPQR